MTEISLPTSDRQTSPGERASSFAPRELLNRILNGDDRTNRLCLGSSLGLFFLIFIMSSVMKDGSSPSDESRLFHMGFTTQVSTPETHLLKIKQPRDLSLLFVGDSLSRYQYLSLVYFLRWGRWFDFSIERSDLVNELSFDNPFHNDTYNEFYYQTGRMLQPYELCDCHQNKERPNMRKYVIENRYYHDPVLNNTVTFVHAFGDLVHLHGRLEAKDVYTDRWKWSAKEKGLLNHKHSPDQWSHDTWVEFFENYVSRLTPKPQYAILNAGQYGSSLGPEFATESDRLKKSIQKLGITSLWRTTTYNQEHAMLGDDAVATKSTDEHMCYLFDECLDVSWTKSVPHHKYWDNHHFHEPVYRVMNEFLLEQLGLIEEDYPKLFDNPQNVSFFD